MWFAVVHTTTSYDLVGVGGGIFGVAGILGAAWAIFRANLAKSTIELQKENNEAFKERVSELERSDKEKTNKISQQEVALNKQGEELKVLRNMVQGIEAIKTLSERIEKNHKEILAAIKERAA